VTCTHYKRGQTFDKTLSCPLNSECNDHFRRGAARPHDARPRLHGEHTAARNIRGSGGCNGACIFVEIDMLILVPQFAFRLLRSKSAG
jgi:hypothetical protein